MNEIIDQMKPKMQKAIDSLAHEFNKIRTGRANPSILDSVKIDYYGNPTPINQAANISVEEGRTLAISPWDKSLIGEIEKAAQLGLGLKKPLFETAKEIGIKNIVDELNKLAEKHGDFYKPDPLLISML